MAPAPPPRPAHRAAAHATRPAPHAHPSEQRLRALSREQLGARGAASEQVSTQEEALQLGSVGTKALRRQAEQRMLAARTASTSGVWPLLSRASARARLEQGAPGIHRAAECGEVKWRHAMALDGLEARCPAGRAPQVRLDGRSIVLDRVCDD